MGSLLVVSPPAAAGDGGSGRDYGRLLVEMLLWTAIASRVFGHQLGVLNVAGLSGAIILIAAAGCLVLVLLRGEQIPVSVLFALGVNVIGNLTDLMLIGLFTRDLVFWLCLLLMTCHLCRDAAAALRLSFFLAGCVFAALALGGTFYDVSRGFGRLGLEPGVAGTMFGNPNDLAQIACLTMTALLFLGLRSKLPLQLLTFATAAGLAVVVLLTLSRQGLVMLVTVLVLYSVAAVTVRGGVRTLLLIALAGTAAFALAGVDLLAEVRDGFLFRWTLESDRVDYWFSSLPDIRQTLLTGRGSLDGYNAQGFLPHSSFLWLHLAYGGACAWLYAGWICWLCWRVLVLLADSSADFAGKMAALTILLVFVSAQFTTVFAAGNYGFILGVALLERLITGSGLDAASGLGPSAPVAATDAETAPG